jgi:hypothetical protein
MGRAHESSADEDDGDVPPDRLYLAVGQHRLIPSFLVAILATQLVGKCLSEVTWVAALQCGGVGRDRYLWGRRWGTALSSN